MANDPLIDTVVAGRYRVLSKLGEGGMGAVYRVEHTSLRKAYALKILRLSTSDAEAVARFDREARAAAHLDHKNIAKCIDVGSVEGLGRYLVMELVDGEPLSALIARERALAPERAIAILKQVSGALGCAHERHVVHRDLKPDNIVLTREGVVKLIDFGIARAKSQALGGGATALTKAGTMLGTPAYMSPEQVVGQAVDARADQYSLGVIAFELLTGTPPYSADEPLSLVFMHVGEAIPRASTRNQALNPAVDLVFDRLLAKLPDERFPSVAAGIEALDAALFGRSTQPAFAAARTTRPSLVSAARASEVSAPAASATTAAAQASVARDSVALAPIAAQGEGRSVGVVVAAVLGALLVLGGVAWFSSSSPEPASTVNNDGASAPGARSPSPSMGPARSNAAPAPAGGAAREPEDEPGERGRGHGHGRGHRR